MKEKPDGKSPANPGSAADVERGIWKANICACGMSQREVADQVEKLLIMMLEGKHTRGYTRGDTNGNAVGNWEEITG